MKKRVKSRGNKSSKSKKTYNNRLLYSLIALGILIVVTTGVYAASYLLTPGVAPNPGHTVGQMAPPSGCKSGDILEWSGSSNADGGWSCISNPGSLWHSFAKYGTGIFGIKYLISSGIYYDGSGEVYLNDSNLSVPFGGIDASYINVNGNLSLGGQWIVAGSSCPGQKEGTLGLCSLQNAYGMADLATVCACTSVVVDTATEGVSATWWQPLWTPPANFISIEETAGGACSALYGGDLSVCTTSTGTSVCSCSGGFWKEYP